MKLKNFFCKFPNPWALRVSGMGGYTSKCEKSQNHCTLLKVVLLHLWRVDVKTIGGFICITLGGFTQLNSRHKTNRTKINKEYKDSRTFFKLVKRRLEIQTQHPVKGLSFLQKATAEIQDTKNTMQKKIKILDIKILRTFSAIFVKEERVGHKKLLSF
jgi:hypothetical protein